jgi:hypothetical protein
MLVLVSVDLIEIALFRNSGGKPAADVSPRKGNLPVAIP